MTITVNFKDDTSTTYEAVKPPWTWRTFLVIDTGDVELTYIPNDNVADFTFAKAA